MDERLLSVLKTANFPSPRSSSAEWGGSSNQSSVYASSAATRKACSWDSSASRARNSSGAELREAFRQRIAQPLLQGVDQRLPDRWVGRLHRVALAEVDQLDAGGREPALRLLELDERVGAGRAEGGGKVHGQTLPRPTA